MSSSGAFGKYGCFPLDVWNVILSHLPLDELIGLALNSAFVATIRKHIRLQARNLDEARMKTLFGFGRRLFADMWQGSDKRSSERIIIRRLENPFENKSQRRETIKTIFLLKSLGQHENILGLRDVVIGHTRLQIHLVHDYMAVDLQSVMRTRDLLLPIHKSFIVFQVLAALKYLHSANVCHTNLKPPGILIDEEGKIRLTDFESACQIGPTKIGPDNARGYVARRWYRPPEMLLGSTQTTAAIDLWSLGCIMAELFLSKPLFSGVSSLNMLEMMCEVEGSASALQDIADMKLAASAENYIATLRSVDIKARSLRELIPVDCSDEGVDLLARLLTFSPLRRITATQALNHPYLVLFHNEEEEVSSHPIDLTTDYGLESFADKDACFDRLVSILNAKPRLPWQSEIFRTGNKERAKALEQNTQRAAN